MLLAEIKNLDISPNAIEAFCTRWQVIEFALFGSVLREDFRPDSDIDVMVQFDINARPTFSSLEDMEEELVIAEAAKRVSVTTRQNPTSVS